MEQNVAHVESQSDALSSYMVDPGIHLKIRRPQARLRIPLSSEAALMAPENVPVDGVLGSTDDGPTQPSAKDDDALCVARNGNAVTVRKFEGYVGQINAAVSCRTFSGRISQPDGVLAFETGIEGNTYGRRAKRTCCSNTSRSLNSSIDQ
jgi:hypothetical protein